MVQRSHKINGQGFNGQMVNRSSNRYVVYLRVSTQRQGRSGLGLEAQQRDVNAFLQYKPGDVVAEFTEIESGRAPVRKILNEALEACQLHHATLLVGTQSRLSRNRAEFFRLLDESGLLIEFADDPYGSPLSVGVKALVAHEEARLISKRTKDALQSAKARGVKLGSHREGCWTPGGAEKRKAALQRGREQSIRARREQANKFAARILPTLRTMRDSGMSLRQICDELENRRISPRRHWAKWTPTQVRNILMRDKQAMS